MESDKNRVLRIVRNAGLAHPSLPLVEAFLNDTVDGDQAARYLLETYAIDGVHVDFVRFRKDWKDLVRRCMFYPQN
ncbi:2cd55bae-526d-4b9d-80b1-1076a0a5dd3d-CDS [Sclerotinia trifoliorum]|uniref:2cd55bae-526d-4b9d-80b1-1076a0a5dd3d-CDS n=1 Tax=Sclerotinia trifoliorum TaxID=28548 RepID=A0A8H2VLA4_9HELO|nr:2cd55bae-526d-4b9d-80b1-1076a0a5dd3d-CDS [Sclerotinia trifoliorum]